MEIEDIVKELKVLNKQINQIRSNRMPLCLSLKDLYSKVDDEIAEELENREYLEKS